MGKREKSDDKKSKKYALIDNNYLAVDTKTEKTMIMCGLATGISCMAFTFLPIGILMYIISILERTKTYIAQSTFILIVCGIAVIGSLAVSIIAKVKNRKSRWAVTNIIFISINLVTSGLSTWFWVWLMNTYGT
jgi:hypothetical protein